MEEAVRSAPSIADRRVGDAPAPHRLVSVIIPWYGRPREVDRSVGSVLAQTHRPIELLLVDDASPEPLDAATVARLDDAHSRGDLSVIRMRAPRNAGPGAAREQARVRASGSYVAYLDSDDEWDPRFLELQLASLDAHPWAAMSYALTTVADPANGGSAGPRDRDREVDAFLPHVLFGRPWHTSACLWRRSATDRIGPWLATRVWEDYDHDGRAGALGLRPVHLPVALCRADKQTGANLSDVPPEQRGDDLARAVIHLVGWLEAYGALGLPGVRERIVDALWGEADRAARRGELDLARRCLATTRVAGDPVDRAASWAGRAALALPAAARPRAVNALRRRVVARSR